MRAPQFTSANRATKRCASRASWGRRTPRVCSCNGRSTDTACHAWAARSGSAGPALATSMVSSSRPTAWLIFTFQAFATGACNETQCATPQNLFACLESPAQEHPRWRHDARSRRHECRALAWPTPRRTKSWAAPRLIDVSGVLQKYADLFVMLGFGTSMAFVADAVQCAVADEDIESILLRIDSPGGTVAGTSDLAATVAAAAKTKPLFAYAEDSVQRRQRTGSVARQQSCTATRPAWSAASAPAWSWRT